MNPLIKLLYYESFCADLQEQHDFARNYSILTGSFYNMDMAQRIISQENPDNSSYHSKKSTDEDFEESTKMVLESRGQTRRGRRRVVNNG